MRKTFIELAPLAAFFICYKLRGLETATLVLVLATLAVLPIAWRLERKLPIAMVLTAVVVGIFGGLSIYLHDSTFLKIKPTIVNLIFAGVLLGGAMRGKGLLKVLFGTALELTEEGWRGLSLRWGCFFLFLAAVNEVVWRTFSESFWVDFKVFGMLTLTLAFTLSQLPFILRHQVEGHKS